MGHFVNYPGPCSAKLSRLSGPSAPLHIRHPSAASRLEGAGAHSSSLSTLKRYAKAVGCDVEIKLVPSAREARAAGR